MISGNLTKLMDSQDREFNGKSFKNIGESIEKMNNLDDFGSCLANRGKLWDFEVIFPLFQGIFSALLDFGPNSKILCIFDDFEGILCF